MGEPATMKYELGQACQTQKTLCHSSQYRMHVARGNLCVGQQHHPSYQINVLKFNVIFVVFFVFIL